MSDESQKLFQDRKIKNILQKLSSGGEKAFAQIGEIGPESCSYLITATRAKDINTRKNATLCLGKIKDKKATEALIKILLEDSELCNSASKALSEQGYQSMKPLIKLLDEEDLNEEKKKKIVSTLDNMDLHVLTKSYQAIYYLAKGKFAECAKLGSDAVPCLIRALTSYDIKLKENAEVTLLRIGLGAISELINTLFNPDDMLRNTVIGILDKIDINLFHPAEKASYYLVKGELEKILELKSSAILPLIRALESPKEEEVDNALKGLKQLGVMAVDDIIKELKGRKRKIKTELIKILGEIKDKKALDVLISCLSDLESEVRINAVKALCEIGDEKAIPFLINKALMDKEKKVRTITGEHLKKMGQAVGKSLIKILEDPKSGEELKEISVNVIGDIKAEIGVKILIKIMCEAKGKLRELAPKALGNIGSKKAVQALISVLDGAKELSGWQRGYNAVIALGKIGDPLALEPLIEILNNEIYLPQMQGAAAEALGKIGDKNVVDELIKSLDNKKIEREVICAIGKLANPKGVEPLKKILYGQNTSTPLKALIIEALGNIGDPLASDDIIELLEKDKLRLPGIVALGKIREEKAVAKLEEILMDKGSEEKIKKACIEAFISIKKEASVLSLIKALKSNDMDINLKNFIIKHFIEMDKIIINPFIKELEKEDENPEFKDNLLQILGSLKASEACSDLVRIMKETGIEYFKGRIILTLGNIKDTLATKTLIEEISNINNPLLLRKASLVSLINIENKKTFSILLNVLEDKDDEFRKFSAEALRKIGVPVIKEEV